VSKVRITEAPVEMDMLEKEQLHVGAAVAGRKRPAPDPPASTRADPFKGPFKIPYGEFCTLADLSPQPCTLAASDLPNAEPSDTLSAPSDEIFDMTSELELDTTLENLTAEESIEIMLAADSSSADAVARGVGTSAERRGLPVREYPPTCRGIPPRENESLQELFETRVMSNYTPRDPKLLPLSAWVSIERLMSELRQHAPAEVDRLGEKGIKQMITGSQMDHPAFASLPFSAWCKKLKDDRPQAHYRAQVMKFPFAHTPQKYTELSGTCVSSKY
jgi:hypothetical protein